jgi:hypothetical protein
VSRFFVMCALMCMSCDHISGASTAIEMADTTLGHLSPGDPHSKIQALLDSQDWHYSYDRLLQRWDVLHPRSRSWRRMVMYIHVDEHGKFKDVESNVSFK